MKSLHPSCTRAVFPKKLVWSHLAILTDSFAHLFDGFLQFNCCVDMCLPLLSSCVIFTFNFMLLQKLILCLVSIPTKLLWSACVSLSVSSDSVQSNCSWKLIDSVSFLFPCFLRFSVHTNRWGYGSRLGCGVQSLQDVVLWETVSFYVTLNCWFWEGGEETKWDPDNLHQYKREYP